MDAWKIFYEMKAIEKLQKLTTLRKQKLKATKKRKEPQLFRF